MTPIDEARRNLEQVMRYRPKTPFARERKAENERTLVAYIEQLEAEAR